MTTLMKSMAKIYARQIHECKITINDVKPQTKEYQKYIKKIYKEIYGVKL